MAGGQSTYNYFDGPTPANALGTTLGILAYVPDQNDNGVVLNGVTVPQLQQQVGVYPTGNSRNPISILPSSLFGSKGAIQPESTPGAFGQQIFLAGPGLWNADISLIKDLGVAEGMHLTLYGEFMNAFNHPNFNFVDSYSGHSNNPAQYLPVNSAPYAIGRVTSTGSRQIQLRLELAF